MSFDVRNSAGDVQAASIIARLQEHAGSYCTGFECVAHVKATTANASAAVQAVGVNGKVYIQAGATYTSSAAFGKAVNASAPLFAAGGGTESITNNAGFYSENQGHANVTNAYGLYIADQSGASGLNYAIYTNAGDIRLMESATDKIGFHGSTPVAQQVLATGAGNDADDIITFLQLIGLCKQA